MGRATKSVIALLALAAATSVPQLSASVEETVTIAAAGDIACDPDEPSFNHGRGTGTRCHEQQTAALVKKIRPRIVLGLGDMQYQHGGYAKYRASYAKSWGAFKSITFVTPGGSHDENASPASGYCAYFGSHGCPNGRTYYSLDVGAWHVISLDGDCSVVGGCGRNSPEERWLREELAAHPTKCTLAFWHFPRWSVGQYGDDNRTATFVSDLYEAGADLILTGHDHIYARFAPQTPDGAAAPNGIPEFVVGTGGKSHLPSSYPLNRGHANLEAANANTYGVLRLTLRPASYDWSFVADRHSPGSFTDSGSQPCHDRPS